ncbi:MAG: hypothetical protein ABIR96_12610 [Bdellovibrionota bacterium]
MKTQFGVSRLYSTILGLSIVGMSLSLAAHASGHASPASRSSAARETVRRSPAQLHDAGLNSMFSLPKFEGVGFALGREGVFRNNAELMKSSSYSSTGQTGYDLLNALKKYTSAKGCVPNLLVAGHGWGSHEGKRETIATGSIARDANKGFNLDGAGATIKGDLARLIKNGEVKFCGSCQIFLHACSISDNYSETLAKVSGCSVVSANDKVSPVDTNSGEYDHVWFTSGGGRFSKYTPTSDGRVSRRTIGEEFIFDPR